MNQKDFMLIFKANFDGVQNSFLSAMDKVTKSSEDKFDKMFKGMSDASTSAAKAMEKSIGGTIDSLASELKDLKEIMSEMTKMLDSRPKAARNKDEALKGQGNATLGNIQKGYQTPAQTSTAKSINQFNNLGVFKETTVIMDRIAAFAGALSTNIKGIGNVKAPDLAGAFNRTMSKMDKFNMGSIGGTDIARAIKLVDRPGGMQKESVDAFKQDLIKLAAQGTEAQKQLANLVLTGSTKSTTAFANNMVAFGKKELASLGKSVDVGAQVQEQRKAIWTMLKDDTIKSEVKEAQLKSIGVTGYKPDMLLKEMKTKIGKSVDQAAEVLGQGRARQIYRNWAEFSLRGEMTKEKIESKHEMVTTTPVKGAANFTETKIGINGLLEAAPAQYSGLQQLGNKIRGVFGIAPKLNAAYDKAVPQRLMDTMQSGADGFGYRLITISYMFSKVNKVLDQAIAQTTSLSMERTTQLAKTQPILMGNRSETGAELSRYSAELQKMSIETGLSYSNLLSSLYDSVSAFPYVADQMSILKTTTMMTQVGFGNAERSMESLIAVAKTYNRELEQSPQAFQAAIAQLGNLSIAAAQVGVLELDELANAMQNMAPMAAAAGVKVEELYGVLAGTAGVIGNTGEASARIQQLLTAIVSPTNKNLKGIYEKEGLNGTGMLEKYGGFVGLLNFLKEDGREWKEIFGRSQAAQAAIGIVGSKSGTVRGSQTDVQKFMEESSKPWLGVDATFKTRHGVDSLVLSIKGAEEEFKKLQSEIGTTMLPAKLVFQNITNSFAKILNNDIIGPIAFFGSKVFLATGGLLGLVGAMALARRAYNVETAQILKDRVLKKAAEMGLKVNPADIMVTKTLGRMEATVSGAGAKGIKGTALASIMGLAPILAIAAGVAAVVAAIAIWYAYDQKARAVALKAAQVQADKVYPQITGPILNSLNKEMLATVYEGNKIKIKDPEDEETAVGRDRIEQENYLKLSGPIARLESQKTVVQNAIDSANFLKTILPKVGDIIKTDFMQSGKLTPEFALANLTKTNGTELEFDAEKFKQIGEDFRLMILDGKSAFAKSRLTPRGADGTSENPEDSLAARVKYFTGGKFEVLRAKAESDWKLAIAQAKGAVSPTAPKLISPGLTPITSAMLARYLFDLTKVKGRGIEATQKAAAEQFTLTAEQLDSLLKYFITGKKEYNTDYASVTPDAAAPKMLESIPELLAKYITGERKQGPDFLINEALVSLKAQYIDAAKEDYKALHGGIISTAEALGITTDASREFSDTLKSNKKTASNLDGDGFKWMAAIGDYSTAFNVVMEQLALADEKLAAESSDKAAGLKGSGLIQSSVASGVVSNLEGQLGAIFSLQTDEQAIAYDEWNKKFTKALQQAWSEERNNSIAAYNKVIIQLTKNKDDTEETTWEKAVGAASHIERATNSDELTAALNGQDNSFAMTPNIISDTSKNLIATGKVSERNLIAVQKLIRTTEDAKAWAGKANRMIDGKMYSPAASFMGSDPFLFNKNGEGSQVKSISEITDILAKANKSFDFNNAGDRVVYASIKKSADELTAVFDDLKDAGDNLKRSFRGSGANAYDDQMKLINDMKERALLGDIDLSDPMIKKEYDSYMKDLSYQARYLKGQSSFLVDSGESIVKFITSGGVYKAMDAFSIGIGELARFSLKTANEFLNIGASPFGLNKEGQEKSRFEKAFRPESKDYIDLFTSEISVIKKTLNDYDPELTRQQNIDAGNKDKNYTRNEILTKYLKESVELTTPAGYGKFDFAAGMKTIMSPEYIKESFVLLGDVLVGAGGLIGSAAGAAADAIGKSISETPFVDKAIKKITKFGDGISKFTDYIMSSFTNKVTGKTDVAHGISTIAGDVASGAATGMTGGPIGAGVGAVIGLFADELGKALAIVKSVGYVYLPFIPMIKAIIDIIKPFIDAILAPLIGTFVIMGQILGVMLVPLFQALAPIMLIFVNLFVKGYNFMLPVLNGFMAIFMVVSAIFQNLAETLRWFMDVIFAIFSGKLASVRGPNWVNIGDAWNAGWNMFTAITLEQVTAEGYTAIGGDDSSSGSGSSADATRLPDQYFNFYIGADMITDVQGGAIVSVDYIWDEFLRRMRDLRVSEASA